MFAAAPERGANDGTVGIHRPYFDRAYFADLTPVQAREKTKQLNDAVKRALDDSDVPKSLQDRLFATPSTAMYWLTIPDLESLGPQPSWYEELLTAKCGIDQETFITAFRSRSEGAPMPDVVTRYLTCKSEVETANEAGYRQFIKREIHRLQSR